MKKTILYIIDSLAVIGGAEVMIVAPLEEVHKNYNIILVTLYPGNAFENYFRGDKQLCLQMNSRLGILSAVIKLKKIIKEHSVDMVHSCLYWSVVVARLACGKKIPHIFSLATVMTEHVYKHKWYSGYTKIIDHLTYKKNQVVIAPSNEVLADFNKAIGIKGRAEMLHNFVADDFFKNQITCKPAGDKIKLVAVGNLKIVKNYQLLIDGFKLLKSFPVTLDIYGDGMLRDDFQRQIKDGGLSINLKGTHKKIYEILPHYDAFVMSSFHEGFGISATEAMATGLPLLLSDIKVFREISQGNALFFDPYKAESFADTVKYVFTNRENLNSFSENGKIIAQKNYTKEKYIEQLLCLYKEVLYMQ